MNEHRCAQFRDENYSSESCLYQCCLRQVTREHLSSAPRPTETIQFVSGGKIAEKLSVHCKLARKLNWVRNRNFFHFEVSFKLNYREVYCQLLVIDKRENLTFRAFQSISEATLALSGFPSRWRKCLLTFTISITPVVRIHRASPSRTGDIH